MSIKTFSIQLDRPSKTYYAGQFITGKIIVADDSELPTRGIAVRFSGSASVSWTESVEEGSGDSIRNVVKRHANEEIYMDEELYAFGRAGLSEDLVIQPGYHEYPFTYQLPPNLPSTFKFEQGHLHADVTYRVEAKVKRSGWKQDHRTTANFSVIAALSVSRYKQTSQPVVVFKEKHLCCFCCKDGPITMNVKVSKTGFVFGDVLNFTVDIINLSSKRISGVEATIEQETRFISSISDFTKEIHEVLLKAIPDGPTMDSNRTESWRGEILVPDLFPTNLGGCHIILRTYTLRVYANLTLARGLKAIVPIIIGSTAPKKGESSTDELENSTEGSKIDIQTPNFNNVYLPPDYKDVVKYDDDDNRSDVNDSYFPWKGTDN